MAARSHPVCFIAMAFDRPDTDRLYDRQILPVLKRNLVKPVIINRRQSNTDLNVQIVQEMIKADFTIADVTYARPSVYWEAGFSQASKQVIYTVRKDHLAPGQPEDLRVHFDLQMKPLIVWKSPDDTAFSVRLEKRIKATVLRDWLAKQAARDAHDAAIRQFASLSPAERLVVMRANAVRVLRSIGYSDWLNLSGARRRYASDDILTGTVNHVFSFRRSRGAFHFASVHAFDSPTKAELQRLRKDMYSPFDGRLRAPGLQVPDMQVTYSNHVVLSIRKVPTDRIEGAFPSFRLVSTPAVFAGVHPTRYRLHDSVDDNGVVLESWHFLSAIASEPQLAERLNDAATQYIAIQAA